MLYAGWSGPQHRMATYAFHSGRFSAHPIRPGPPTAQVSSGFYVANRITITGQRPLNQASTPARKLETGGVYLDIRVQGTLRSVLAHLSEQ